MSDAIDVERILGTTPIDSRAIRRTVSMDRNERLEPNTNPRLAHSSELPNIAQNSKTAGSPTAD